MFLTPANYMMTRGHQYHNSLITFIDFPFITGIINKTDNNVIVLRCTSQYGAFAGGSVSCLGRQAVVQSFRLSTCSAIPELQANEAHC